MKLRVGDTIPFELNSGNIVEAKVIAINDENSYMVRRLDDDDDFRNIMHIYRYKYDHWLDNWLNDNPNHPLAKQLNRKRSVQRTTSLKKLPYRMMESEEYEDRKKKSSKAKPKRKPVKKCKCK